MNPLEEIESLVTLLPPGSAIKCFHKDVYSRSEAWGQVPMDEPRNRWRKAHTKNLWCWYRTEVEE